MKRISGIGLHLVVAIFAILLISSKSAEAQTKTKVFIDHTYASDALYDMEVIRWFYQELTKRTNGRYSVEHYYGQSLAKAADQVSACASGIIDSFFNSLGYNPAEFVLNRAFEHVGITGSFDVQAKAIMHMYDNQPLIRQEWERQNLVLVAPVLQTEMILMTKKPIKSIEDLRGQKLRGYAQSGKALQMLGAEIITIAAPERYDALAKGVVDGMSGIALDVGYAERLHEGARFITDTGLGVYSFTYFAMSKKVFDSLPEEDRNLIRTIGLEMVDKMVKDFPEMHQRMITDMIKNYNVELYEFTPEEKQRVLSIVTPAVWQEWVEEANKLRLPGQKILDEYIAAIKKFEKEDRYISPWETYRQMSK